jgi:ribokinase
VAATLDVIGFGAMNLDEIAVVPKIVLDGETQIQALRRSPGGSAANTVYGLAKVGMRTGFVGAVGDDGAGRILVQDLKGVGVDTIQVVVKRGEASGFVWALADASHRSLNVYPGANDLLRMSDIRLSYLRRARLVHLSSFVNPRQLALQRWLVRRLPPSVMISFAPGRLYAERGVLALRPILERTAVVFVNLDEARLLTRKTDPRSSAHELLRLGCRTVVITLGEGGEIKRAESRLRPGPRSQEREAGEPRRSKGSVRAACFLTDGKVEEVVRPIASGRPAVDSVGAGDAFAAGFLYGVLRECPLRECARLGQIVARCSVQAPGAREALPTLRQLRQAYRRQFGAAPW